jgi:GTP-binding protein
MIKQAEFIKSITNVSQLPEEKAPYLLLLGRSNVGKSSFINAVCNRKSLARVSNTPGKTITLNLYLLNESIYLVDAPGYGYAKRSWSTQDEFLKMISNFVMNNEELAKIFLLVDFKVGPTVDDLNTYQQLIKLDKEVIIIATKYDKIKSSLRLKQTQTIKKNFLEDQAIYFVSNETKYGIDQVIKLITNT